MAAMQMMLSGETGFAVILQGNTIGGPVYNYVDELMAHDGISIVGEIKLPIRQALLARKARNLTTSKWSISMRMALRRERAG